MPALPESSDSGLPPKARGAYKTISEVADELGVPQHVLRFWESHFPQVKPSRMRGSRRYYRPEDVDMLKMIKTLLYSKGYTIKGAKQVVRSGAVLEAIAPVQPKAAAVPVATAATKKTVADQALKPTAKDADKQSLVSELRVLKSMLTSLL